VCTICVCAICVFILVFICSVCIIVCVFVCDMCSVIVFCVSCEIPNCVKIFGNEMFESFV
jgi:hypothetical protein